MTIVPTIIISKEAYFYMRGITRKQRGCDQLNKTQEARIWKRLMGDITRQATENEVAISQDDFGGGDGTYRGQWTKWSLDQIKGMLDDAGYTYREGEPLQYSSSFGI